MSSWASQDGVAASRIPTLGDTVTINGIITVDQATSVGTGSGDVLSLNTASSIGAKKLIVNAPLSVRGSIMFATNAVIDVQAGAGIEMDANAGQTPLIHTPQSKTMHLYFHGTAANHSYLRTMPGTAGNAAQILPDYMYGTPMNIGATYTDFADLNAGPGYATRDLVGKWGIFLWPSSSSLMNSIDHSTFTRTSFWMQDNNLGSSTFTFSDNVFSDSTLTNYYDQTCSYAIVVHNNVSLLRNGFDKYMYTQNMKDVVSNVFLSGVWNRYYSGPAFTTWSDNLVRISDPSSGYFKYEGGLYSRGYFIHDGYAASNPHITGLDAVNNTIDQCIFDVPFANDVDDTLMMLSAGAKNTTVRNSIALPRSGGPYPGAGISMGFLGGTGIRYEHNTIATGRQAGIASDPSHGGTTGGLESFRSNLLFTSDAYATPGNIFNTYPSTYLDLVLPGNADYNGRYRATYTGLNTTGTPGAHDVVANPNFVDGSRNLMNYYRMKTSLNSGNAQTDTTAALTYIHDHPELMPEMIDWVRGGFAPTNPAMQQAYDPTGSAVGWIGAVTGIPPVQVLSWASANDHLRNVGEAVLSIPDDGSFSEPRNGGISRLLVHFDGAIDPASFTAAHILLAGNGLTGTINLTGVTISTSLRDSNTTGVIQFSQPLPDTARYLVRLSGVKDTLARDVSGDTDIVLTALKGDVSGDRRVNVTDLSYVSSRYADPIGSADAAQVRADLNQDGRTNVTDVSYSWAQRNHDTRAIVDPVIGAAAPILTQAASVKVSGRQATRVFSKVPVTLSLRPNVPLALSLRPSEPALLLDTLSGTRKNWPFARR